MKVIVFNDKRINFDNKILKYNPVLGFDWLTNIIGYFKFDNNLDNAAGTLTMTGSSPVFETGKNNQAFKINTTIQSNHHLYSSKFSFGFWHRATNGNQYILSFNNPSNMGIFNLSAGYVSISTINGYYSNYTDYGTYDGNWHYFLCSLDNNTLTVYNDANLVYSVDIGAPLTDYNLALKIPQITVNEFWLDEFAIWDGRIITSDEASKIYNNGIGIFL